MIELIEIINLYVIMIRGNGYRVLVFGNKNICMYLFIWIISGYKVKLYIFGNRNGIEIFYKKNFLF